MAPRSAVAGPSAAPAPVDGGWPRGYTTASGASLVIYQPQIASWRDQQHAVMYAAVSYGAQRAAAPALGTIKVEADTAVAVAERLVTFASFDITETNFPTVPNDQLRPLAAEIATTVSAVERVIALDRVLANMDKSQIVPRNVPGVKADPPVVFFSTAPAVLVGLDGEAIWSPIAGNDLKYAVNTNWDLFQYTPSGTYYLRHNVAWLQAPALPGPWTPVDRLPASFSTLPADDNWKDVKAAVPGVAVAPGQAAKVFVTTKPAELILLAGAPDYDPVPGTNLLWVANTDSDLFRLGKTGTVYYLVAGRWFSAPDFAGPWTFASLALPPDFKQIPLDHPRSRVLASVPGTEQAAEAVLLAQVPQTARVSKTDVKAPDVAFQGSPTFEPIAQTTVERAVNTDKDVIKVGDLYYLCFQGVWFMSRAATGPWEVTGAVPSAIYLIPVSSPAYSVTYVTVQQETSDAVVFAAAAAYTGVMVAWGCAVWGTGYYYPPYIGYGGAYPIYHPYYPTYGYSAWYNPWTASYGRGTVAYGPYGGAGVGARYNPATGTYARGAAAWGPYGGVAAGQAYNPRTGTYAQGAMAVGPYGAQGAAQAYNPRTGTYGATRQGSNVYGSWGQTGVQRGDQWATTSRYSSNVTGATTRTAQTGAGGAAVGRSGPTGNSFAGPAAGGDMYAGHDGNVYQKQGDSWKKYDNGSWNDVQKPTPQSSAAGQRASSFDPSTMSHLNSDAAARAQGAERSSGFSGLRSGDGGNWGSYRPSGGGGAAFGAGGRRR